MRMILEEKGETEGDEMRAADEQQLEGLGGRANSYVFNNFVEMCNWFDGQRNYVLPLISLYHSHSFTRKRQWSNNSLKEEVPSGLYGLHRTKPIRGVWVNISPYS